MQLEKGSKKEKESGSINIRSLKKIVTIMNRAKLTELNIEQDGFKIHLKKGGEIIQQAPMMMQQPMQMQAPMMAPAASAPAVVSAGPIAEVEDPNCVVIKSPMVGTFYRSPSPESDVFTDVGRDVVESSVVCIVEAMKLMNEIKAEVKGKIKKILVENAQPIEYGQPLFIVERK